MLLVVLMSSVFPCTILLLPLHASPIRSPVFFPTTSLSTSRGAGSRKFSPGARSLLLEALEHLLPAAGRELVLHEEGRLDAAELVLVAGSHAIAESAIAAVGHEAPTKIITILPAHHSACTGERRARVI
jgi:hypothetical protein